MSACLTFPSVLHSFPLTYSLLPVTRSMNLSSTSLTRSFIHSTHALTHPTRSLTHSRTRSLRSFVRSCARPPAIREYAISPLLYTLTDTHTSPSPSYASAHPYLHNVIATAVSGGSVGSIMAYAKGRSVPGNGAFFAALCASWQVAGNLLSAVRHRGDHHQSAESSKIPAETSSSSSSTPHPPTPSPPSSSWWEALKEAAPVRRIPDEEYAASLTKRQEELKEELRMLLQLEKEWEARSGKRQGESDGKSVDKARSV